MTNTPDFGDVLAASLRDIWPAIRSWGGWAIASMIGVTAVGAWVIPLLPLAGQRLPPQDVGPFMGGIGLGVLLLVPVTFFSLASAVRTVKPEFRMTAGTLFGSLGYSILAGLIVMLGFVLLVIPGFYFLVKVTLAPYFYFLRDGDEDPIGQSWALTRDRFWLTAAMIVVVGIGGEIVTYAASIIADLLVAVSFALIIAAIPIGMIAYFVVIQFTYNAYARWAYALKTSSTLSNTGTAVPPTVTP